jgi:glutamate synthase domain-containing protein 3
VLVLGRTGRNFAAGMSGGIAYVYDVDGQFANRCNTAMVSLGKVLPATEHEKTVDRAIWHRGECDEALLRRLIADHHKWTGSLRARHILDHWSEERGKFVKVFPSEYRRALAEMGAKAASASRESEAQVRAGETIERARSKAKTVPAK